MPGRAIDKWLFGKLPAQGDFVSRGLDHKVRDQLDRWLSHEMEAAKERFADFDERYMHAPACNFVDCDEDGRWSGGAMCASVDKVGRRFPIILSAPADDAGSAAGISGACLFALHEAFSSGWDADSLYAAELLPVELPWTPDVAEWALVSEEGPAYVARERFPEGIVSAMLEMAS
ncbi:MAG: type VI secretion system-associated protein TagF [Novosphingobium sp.]|nr:type VI secretion system-associated protein TagF [Novosphingobium sp.]